MKFINFYLIISVMLNGNFALATLGEHESQIAENEGKHFSVRAQKATQNSGYKVHELTLDGTTVKEFADSSGTVFAVTWKGMKAPDLSVVFGSYFTEYKNAREKAVKVRGRRAVNLTTESLVFQQAGTMRNIGGSAYVPKLVPPGIDVQDLK